MCKKNQLEFNPWKPFSSSPTTVMRSPRVKVYREGWEATSRTAADQLEGISMENLEEAGRVISLSLMIMGRETDY
ncbi:MAG: hypothetical protein GQ524_06965 [Anaerolineales bacterium]|nr:hypothetical protein [Anaerolineales bacterium]